jgi:hypothetical protein
MHDVANERYKIRQTFFVFSIWFLYFDEERKTCLSTTDGLFVCGKWIDMYSTSWGSEQQRVGGAVG